MFLSSRLPGIVVHCMESEAPIWTSMHAAVTLPSAHLVMGQEINVCT